MRRLVLVLAALTAFGLVTVASMGCEDPRPDAQAMHVVANTFVSTRTQCQIRAGATEFRPRGILDLAVSNTYILYPQVENLLDPSEDYTGLTNEELRLNNNNITIRGATVYYDFSPDDPFLWDGDGDGVGVDPAYWDFYQGVFVHASGSIQPGETAPTLVPVIPWELGNEIALQIQEFGGVGTELVVRVTVEGALSDGTPVQSNEFWYPITICNGCLVYFPPFVDPRILAENVTVPCVPGQDDGVDTRICYAYAAGDATTTESLNRARDKCRWLHILQGVEPPDSQFYFDRYQAFFPGVDQPCGLNGVNCR